MSSFTGVDVLRTIDTMINLMEAEFVKDRDLKKRLEDTLDLTIKPKIRVPGNKVVPGICQHHITCQHPYTGQNVCKCCKMPCKAKMCHCCKSRKTVDTKIDTARFVELVEVALKKKEHTPVVKVNEVAKLKN